MFDLKNISRLLGVIVLLVYATLPQASVSSYPQKVDKALDSNFEVELRNGYTYCVAPYLAKDNIYYAYETARKNSTDCIGYDWRYDVHGHISTVITTEGDQPDNFYLCMTDVASDDTSTYSYIQLKPCSVNNTRQIWKYNETTKQMVNQHTGYRLQEINWYLATSAKSSNLYDLKVTGREIIFSLVPAPFTLAYQFNFHYPFEGKSYTRILGKDGHISDGPLRYDPQTRQISKLMPDGYQYCLRSNMLGTTTDSEFVSFQRCPDRYGDGIVPNTLKWNITSSCTKSRGSNSYKLMISDFKGNIFGVERSGGIAIGTGYTIKPGSIKLVPSRFKPQYIFQDAGEVSGRQDYLAGNYLGSLRRGICPAPGIFNRFPDSSNPAGNGLLSADSRVARLPPDFNLLSWINRLYQISTHPGGLPAAGPCGSCMLHAAEMLLEMHWYGNQPPNEENPLYFSLDPNTTSMDDFRERFSTLAASFFEVFEDSEEGSFDPDDLARDSVLALEFQTGAVLCRLLGGSGLEIESRIYFNSQRLLEPQDELQQMVDDMRSSSDGTMFMLNYEAVTGEGDNVGHSIALVWNGGELNAIPTTEDGSLISEQFFESLVDENITTGAGLEHVLRFYRPEIYAYVEEAVIFFITPQPAAPVSPGASFDEDMLSVGNCTEGAVGSVGQGHGFGSGLPYAIPEFLYQCTDGRCDTSAARASENNNNTFSPRWPQQCEWLERVNHRWSWNGGSVWAKQHTSAASCRQANRCASGGGCYRWSGALDIGQCEHLWRNGQGQWQWFPYRYYTREKACRDANQCNGNGPCFRWNDGRP